MEIDEKDVSDYHYEGEVTEMPDNFTAWVEKNQERISAAKVKPYFIEDNFVDGDTSKGYVWKQKKVVAKAKEISDTTMDSSIIPTCEAKTPQEAVDYIKKYIADEVTLPIKKGDLPLLNEYLSHVSQRMEEFGMERFSVVGVPESRKAMASFSRQNNSYNLNMSALRNYTKQWENELKWRKKGIRYLAYESEDDVIRHALDHELGHKLLYQYKMKGEAERLLTTAFREIDTVVGNYASTNADELFAECFAMYMGKGRAKMVETKGMIEKMIEQVTEQLQKVDAPKRGGMQGNFNWESKQAAKDGRKAYEQYDSKTTLTKKQKQNIQKIKSKIGDESELETRDFFDADSGIPNEIKGDSNCVNVCFANELLRRGVNVSASNAFVKEVATDKYNQLFVNTEGKCPNIRKISGKNEEIVYNKLIKEIIATPGARYILGGNDPIDAELYRNNKIKKDDIAGHVISVEVTNKREIVAYDHQLDAYISLKAMANSVDIIGGIEVLRIDNLLINPESEFIQKLLQVR